MAGQVRIVVRSDDPEQLREILRREDLDLNCSGARKASSGEWFIEAYTTFEVATRLSEAGYRVEIDKNFERRMARRRSDVSKQDRFKDGHTPPKGVGKKE